MFDKLKDLKDLFKDDQGGFFRNILKGLLWAFGLLNFEQIEQRIRKLFSDMHKSGAFQEMELQAKKFYNGLRVGVIKAFWPYVIGWGVAAFLLLLAGVKDTGQKPWALAGIVAELIGALFAVVLLMWQSTKAYAIALVGQGLLRIFGSGIDTLKSTLPDAFFQNDPFRSRRSTAIAPPDELIRKIWAPALIILAVNLLLTVVLCVGFRVFNVLVATLIIVNVVGVLIAHALRYGEDPEFRIWSKAFSKKVAKLAFAGVLIGIPTFALGGSVFDGYFAKVKTWAEQHKKVAEIQGAVLDARAEAAKADALATNAAIQNIEEQVLKTGTMTESQRKELAKLRKRFVWNAEGRAKGAPLPPPPPPAAPPPPTPTCSDGVDNDKDGYVDKDSHKCYLVSINCSKSDKKSGACVDRFADWQNGKPVRDLWFRYNPNGDEKTEPKWTQDVLAAEKKKQQTASTGTGNGNGNGNGQKNQAKIAQELAAIEACFKLGKGCKL